ncbi:MAG TPA: dihydropteroate synthase [Gemmatimonadales bacterium]|nr:dihydropteroate synthase [Gemmatimonadales bacterium]
MNVTPLALHSPRAVRDTLRAHGWDDGQAAAASGGIHPLAFHVAGLDQGTLQALVRLSGTLGLEVLTGDGWAIMSGSRSRLSAFARPWLVPPELSPLAHAVGLAMPAEPAGVWRTARGPIALDRPILLGILNVTPDSFSDGGRFVRLDAALAQADALLEAGAALLDLGGESTRPGRVEAVAESVELERVLPVVEALVRRHPSVVLTIDTVKSGVARAALAAGAAAINDVSALRLDAGMARAVGEAGAGLILMHSRGSILEIASYTHAGYADVVSEVMAELRLALAQASDAGIPDDAVVIDPGFGFSKTVDQNILLFDQLDTLQSLGRPVLVGPSRKRFLGAVTGQPLDTRDRATAVACALAWERGARLFRVHDVASARDALTLAQAVGGS